jgi:hypothetical protein
MFERGERSTEPAWFRPFVVVVVLLGNVAVEITVRPKTLDTSPTIAS